MVRGRPVSASAGFGKLNPRRVSVSELGGCRWSRILGGFREVSASAGVGGVESSAGFGKSHLGGRTESGPTESGWRGRRPEGCSSGDSTQAGIESRMQLLRGPSRVLRHLGLQGVGGLCGSRLTQSFFQGSSSSAFSGTRGRGAQLLRLHAAQQRRPVPARGGLVFPPGGFGQKRRDRGGLLRADLGFDAGRGSAPQYPRAFGGTGSVIRAGAVAPAGRGGGFS